MPDSLVTTSFVWGTVSGLEGPGQFGRCESNDAITVNCSRASITNGSHLICKAAMTLPIWKENLAPKFRPLDYSISLTG